jgi:peptide/nickel transport system ATP-binding protein
MTVLEVKDLHMYYRLFDGRSVRAVDGVSFCVDKGKTTGIVGESGCGKSSIAITILRVLPDNADILGGSILLHNGELGGRNGAIDVLRLSEEEMQKVRWKGISMIFQGAMNSLNPVYRVGDQVAEAIIFHEGVSKEKAKERVQELFRLVGIDPSRMNDYPHQYSGGMKQRAVIAMALATNPKLVIADEPTTALDLIVQDQILQEIREIQRKLGMSMIFISHDLPVAFEVSDVIAIMYAGRIMEHGDKRAIYQTPLHPYTQGLLASHPEIKGKRGKLSGIPGEPPNLIDPILGCEFANRCPFTRDICEKEKPELVGTSHLVACHFAGEVDFRKA